MEGEGNTTKDADSVVQSSLSLPILRPVCTDTFQSRQRLGQKAFSACFFLYPLRNMSVQNHCCVSNVTQRSGGGAGSTLLEAPVKSMTLCRISLDSPFCPIPLKQLDRFQGFIILLKILKQVCKVQWHLSALACRNRVPPTTKAAGEGSLGQ